MSNNGKQKTSLNGMSHNDSGEKLSDKGYLWRITVFMILYGTVHLILGVFVVYYPEAIMNQWYSSATRWFIAVGPMAVALPWYLWARWKNAP